LRRRDRSAEKPEAVEIEKPRTSLTPLVGSTATSTTAARVKALPRGAGGPVRAGLAAGSRADIRCGGVAAGRGRAGPGLADVGIVRCSAGSTIRQMRNCSYPEHRAAREQQKKRCERKEAAHA